MSFQCGDVVVDTKNQVMMTVEKCENEKVACIWFPDDGTNILSCAEFSEADLELFNRKDA